MPIDWLRAGLPQTFNLKNTIPAKLNKAKSHKARSACYSTNFRKRIGKTIWKNCWAQWRLEVECLTRLKKRIYIYVYIYIHIHIYVYIYKERDRERERVEFTDRWVSYDLVLKNVINKTRAVINTGFEGIKKLNFCPCFSHYRSLE